MSTTNIINQADLDWGDAARPRSIAFDDIYFSGDGPAETTHVFLHGNDLPARFEQAPRFTIGELGFGTGLNFLVAWDAWRRAPKSAGAKLHFFSVEALALSPSDMARAHQHWPALASLANTLRRKLPPPHGGFHQIAMDDDVTLTLYYGDAFHVLSRAELHADAWFLDGFSPAKNPAMWSAQLFAQMARLSKPGATFSTYTVAGVVRRALQDTGFAVEKRSGFGKKRDMLAGRLTQPVNKPKRKPWFDVSNMAPLPAGRRIAIIGAGIAGASLAHALRRAGLKPTVFEATAPASGASGNRAGLIMPRLDVGPSPDARFHVSAYLFTIGLLNELQTQSDETLFNRCGVLLHATNDKERAKHEKLIATNALPEAWMIARDEGLFLPQAGVVDPAAFVRALLADMEICIETVTGLTHNNGQWRVDCESGKSDWFDGVVIANGLGALRFSQMRPLPLIGSAGQLDYFAHAAAPPHVHVFGPYAAPAPGGGLVIGATYEPFTPGQTPTHSIEATRSNLKIITETMPALVAGLAPHTSTPRAAVRCVTPDFLPVVGPVPDWDFYSGAYQGLTLGSLEEYPPAQTQPGLYALTALGSRGLVTAPLAAAMIVSQMVGAPAPCDVDVAEANHPARFFVRDLKRNIAGK